MSRRMARESAMKLLFQMDLQGDYSPSILERYIEDLPENQEEIMFIRDIGTKFIEYKEMVDEKIAAYTKEWRFDRIAKVDLAILRLAVVEIMFREDIPDSVSINEGVELAKQYSTEESGSFINGILGSIVVKQ
ncbi:MAG: transcription antitermination factor NusB [Bacillota bacterium]